MPGYNTPYDMYGADILINDPGDGGTINVDRSLATVVLACTGAETRTLILPNKSGLDLFIHVSSGSCVITYGANTLTMDSSNDTVHLHSVPNGSDFTWRNMTDGTTPVGTVTVRHADGTVDTFEPAGESRNDRGDALVLAAAALVTRTSADQPGSSLYLDPGADYEVTDLLISGKDGISFIGQDNTIWNVPDVDYDYILNFTSCDDVLLKGVKCQGDGAVTSASDPSTVVNTGDGASIKFVTCERPKVIDCAGGGGTGGATVPYTYNGGAHGLWFASCNDIYVDGFVSIHAGCWGIATTSACTRITIKNCFIYNAHSRSMQLTPAANNPYTKVSDCILLSDETVDTQSTDTDWFPYDPYIDVGEQGYTTELVTMDNVSHLWLNPSASETAAGAGYPLLKVVDVRDCKLTNCIYYHGNAFSSGTGAPYTTGVILQPTILTDSRCYMKNCYLSLDMRNFGGTSFPIELYADGCSFGQDQTHGGTFYQFAATKAVFHNCDFDGWTNYVFDMWRDISGYLEAVNCTFHGSATTDTVVRDETGTNANLINTWAGDYLFYNNTYDTCRPASDSNDRLILNQATGDRNVCVWDDSLAGDLVHPSPGTSPGVFASANGRAGMRIKNKNYSPNATSTWAAEYAWWSTSTGSYQDS